MDGTTSAQGLQLGKGLKILLSSAFENYLQVSSLSNSQAGKYTHTNSQEKLLLLLY